MGVKLLTEQHLEFLSLKEGCTGSSESRYVKMPHCWKSHVTAQLYALAGDKFSSVACIRKCVMLACLWCSCLSLTVPSVGLWHLGSGHVLIV